jgi:hypothetical protein
MRVKINVVYYSCSSVNINVAQSRIALSNILRLAVVVHQDATEPPPPGFRQRTFRLSIPANCASHHLGSRRGLTELIKKSTVGQTAVGRARGPRSDTHVLCLDGSILGLPIEYQDLQLTEEARLKLVHENTR